MAETAEAPAQDERQRIAGLVAHLAKKTGDEKLFRLVDIALDVDAAPWIRRGGRRLSKAERWLARADRWLRVWAHLAESHAGTAKKRSVLVMGYSGRVEGDGTAWASAAVASLHPKKTVACIWVGPEGANIRDAAPPGATSTALREAAAELAGVGFAAVCWGTLGQAKPKRSWHIDLPAGTRAAERAVEEGIAAAVNAALAYVRRIALARDGGPTRKRLDHHPRQLAVYLLHHGYGRVKKRGWRRTGRVLFPSDTIQVQRDCSPQAIARDYRVACRRISLAAGLAGFVSVKLP